MRNGSNEPRECDANVVIVVDHCKGQGLGRRHLARPILCHIEPMRDITDARRSVAALLMQAAFLCGVPSPASTQDAAMVEVDTTMENYRLDAHIPGVVW